MNIFATKKEMTNVLIRKRFGIVIGRFAVIIILTANRNAMPMGEKKQTLHFKVRLPGSEAVGGGGGPLRSKSSI